MKDIDINISYADGSYDEINIKPDIVNPISGNAHRCLGLIASATKASTSPYARATVSRGGDTVVEIQEDSVHMDESQSLSVVSLSSDGRVGLRSVVGNSVLCSPLSENISSRAAEVFPFQALEYPYFWGILACKEMYNGIVIVELEKRHLLGSELLPTINKLNILDVYLVSD